MTVADAAARMVELMNEHGYLEQEYAAGQLFHAFGEEAVYSNNNGNLAIKKEILAAFNRLTPDAVWLRASRYWRPRQEGDRPGRQQPW